eukprot:gene9829-11481_t
MVYGQEPAPMASSIWTPRMDEFLAVINAARSKAGVAPMTESSCLMKSADDYASYMKSLDTMTPPKKYPNLIKKIEATGGAKNIMYAAEIVARGYSNEVSLANAWLASYSSYLLNAKFTVIGLGMDVVASDNSHRYWAAHVMVGDCGPSQPRNRLAQESALRRPTNVTPSHTPSPTDPSADAANTEPSYPSLFFT